MPIRPENRLRYPPDWKTVVVPRIRKRSEDRCECLGECGRQHGPDIDGRCLRMNGTHGAYDGDRDGHWIDALSGEIIDGVISRTGYQLKVVKIVLTVGHLNHQPEDCADDNLKHWCQGCHNRYDAPVRRAGIKQRAHAQRAVGDLFCEELR